MPTWPLTLPQSPLMDGYTETPPENTIRTQMDVGPDKVRRRTTSNPRPIQCSYVLTGAQLTILDDFYTGDAAGGATEFDMPHPRTGVTVSVRFRAAPTYTAVQGNFRAALDIEVLP